MKCHSGKKKQKTKPLNSNGMNTSCRLNWSHISPSNLAVCLLSSAFFAHSFSLNLRNLEDGMDIGQMPWQQPPNEVGWFGCLQEYAGIIPVLCGIKIIFIYMSSNLFRKKDFCCCHTFIFSIQEYY